MKIQRIWRKRRAVSPILAAILLIGLAVAAGAVLFIVVLPMIQSSGSLAFDTQVKPITFSDTDDNGTYDKVVCALKNEAAETATVTAITIQGNSGPGWEDVTNPSTTTNLPLTINSGQGVPSITYTWDEDTTFTKYRIKVAFEIGDDAQDPIYSAEYTAP